LIYHLVNSNNTFPSIDLYQQVISHVTGNIKVVNNHEFVIPTETNFNLKRKFR